MPQIFNNAISVSIITGIVVFFITWPINNALNKRGNKSKHFQDVKNGNEKLMEILKEYIISFHDINSIIIEALAKAEAIKANVQRSNLYNLEEIKVLLVRAFVDIRLIPDDQRKSIITNILSISEEPVNNELEQEYGEQEHHRQRNQLLVTLMTALVALVAAFLTMITSLPNSLEVGLSSTHSEIFLPIILTVSVAEVCILIAFNSNLANKRNLRIEKMKTPYKKKDNRHAD